METFVGHTRGARDARVLESLSPQPPPVFLCVFLFGRHLMPRGGTVEQSQSDYLCVWCAKISFSAPTDGICERRPQEESKNSPRNSLRIGASQSSMLGRWRGWRGLSRFTYLLAQCRMLLVPPLGLRRTRVPDQIMNRYGRYPLE